MSEEAVALVRRAYDVINAVGRTGEDFVDPEELAPDLWARLASDFEPIAKEVLVVKSPGAALADPAEFSWQKLRKGVRLRPLGPVRL